MPQAASANDHRGRLMTAHRDRGFGLLVKTGSPIGFAPASGVGRVHDHHREPSVAAHLDQPVTEHGCGQAGHSPPPALGVKATAHGLPAHLPGIDEVHVLDRNRQPPPGPAGPSAPADDASGGAGPARGCLSCQRPLALSAHPHRHCRGCGARRGRDSTGRQDKDPAPRHQRILVADPKPSADANASGWLDHEGEGKWAKARAHLTGR